MLLGGWRPAWIGRWTALSCFSVLCTHTLLKIKPDYTNNIHGCHLLTVLVLDARSRSTLTHPIDIKQHIYTVAIVSTRDSKAGLGKFKTGFEILRFMQLLMSGLKGGSRKRSWKSQSLRPEGPKRGGAVGEWAASPTSLGSGRAL